MSTCIAVASQLPVQQEKHITVAPLKRPRQVELCILYSLTAIFEDGEFTIMPLILLLRDIAALLCGCSAGGHPAWIEAVRHFRVQRKQHNLDSDVVFFRRSCH